MYSPNQQSTYTDKQIYQQYHIPTTYKNSEQTGNYNRNIMQYRNIPQSIPRPSFIKSPENTLAEMYYTKYGNLTNFRRPVSHHIGPIQQPNIEQFEMLFDKSKHINKRSESPPRYFDVQKPNIFMIHNEEKYAQRSSTPRYNNVKALHQFPVIDDWLSPSHRKSAKRDRSPANDFFLMEKSPAFNFDKSVQNMQSQNKKIQDTQQNLNSKDTQVIFTAKNLRIKSARLIDKSRIKEHGASEKPFKSKNTHLKELNVQKEKSTKNVQEIKATFSNKENNKKSDKLKANNKTSCTEKQKVKSVQSVNTSQHNPNERKSKLKMNSKSMNSTSQITQNEQHLKKSQTAQCCFDKKSGEQNSNVKNGLRTACSEGQNMPQNIQSGKNTYNQKISKNTQKIKSAPNSQTIKVNKATFKNNSQAEPGQHPNNQANQNKNSSQNSKKNENLVTDKRQTPATQNQDVSVNKNEDTLNKTTKSVNSSKNTQKCSSPKNNDDPVQEIFKTCHKSTGNIGNNASLQKVTEDLTNIIKNLQKQIQEVPASKSNKVNEVPSALIETKEKHFFVSPPPKPSIVETTQKSKSFQSSNQNSKQIVPFKSNSTKITTSNSNSFNRTKASSLSNVISNRRLGPSTRNSMTGRLNTPPCSKVIIKRSSSQTIDHLKLLREEVQKAIRGHKTFTVRGQFCTIRNALRTRGWIEKFHPTYKDSLNSDLKRYISYSINDLVPLIKRENVADLCKCLIKSKLLGNYQVDFYWAIHDEGFRDNPDKIKMTTINKLKRDIFSYTNKQGLCDASKCSYWYQKEDVSKLNHPRSFSLATKNGEVKGFMEDFRYTAAMSLLKWVIKTSITKESKLISPSGKIPLEVFDFAVNECCKFIKKQKHDDIDIDIPEATDKEWNIYLDYFYKIVHYCNHFTEEKRESEESIVRKANYIVNILREVWPWIDMDGMMNIWILKPVASSRGRGIHLCRTLQYILKIIKDHTSIRYIIQKYIERPLLIHHTKFDIRQWFLISNCSPLTIWMYKECYLRFSSQTYNLRKLHESIHLTNNSVQRKYAHNSIDTALPTYNMWDSKEFKSYLTNIGYPSAYNNIIYPGMKQCITAAVLMHQDKMIIRKNCFELYGADFILTEDFQPWLLEINSNPALYSSTPVTSRMCPRVLDDVIKVIVDYTRNCKSNTGDFEMIYKEQILTLPAPPSLELEGKPLNKEYFNYDPEEEKKVKNKCEEIMLPDKTHDNFKIFTEEIKATLKNLLQIIHEERRKREIKCITDKIGSPLCCPVENKKVKTKF